MTDATPETTPAPEAPIRVTGPTDPAPHCSGPACGVAPHHYDTACDCPCEVCDRQRDALEEVRQ